MRTKPTWPEIITAAKARCATSAANHPPPDGREIFNEIVTTATTDRIRTWRGFQEWADRFDDTWAFRGHTDAAWDLETSLDRATILHYRTKLSSGTYRRAASHEKWMLDEFQKRAHQYLSHLPSGDEVIDWLALMQHYGAPTRLLDWTRSPYVALYFALEKTVPSPAKERDTAAMQRGRRTRRQKPAAVWAINCEWALKEAAKSWDQFDPNLPDAAMKARISRLASERLAGEAHSDGPLGIVFPVDLHHVNERMVAQQGLHLCSPQCSPPFDIALLTMVFRDENPDTSPIRKLIIRPQNRIPFLKELRRMNITAASLFPGLEGFGRSLAAELEIKMVDEKIAAGRQAASTDSSLAGGD